MSWVVNPGNKFNVTYKLEENLLTSFYDPTGTAYPADFRTKPETFLFYPFSRNRRSGWETIDSLLPGGLLGLSMLVIEFVVNSGPFTSP